MAGRRSKCESCGKAPAISAVTRLCEACAYRATMGDSAHERQTAAATADRARRKPPVPKASR